MEMDDKELIERYIRRSTTNASGGVMRPQWMC